MTGRDGQMDMERQASDGERKKQKRGERQRDSDGERDRVTEIDEGTVRVTNRNPT